MGSLHQFIGIAVCIYSIVHWFNFPFPILFVNHIPINQLMSHILVHWYIMSMVPKMIHVNIV